ncbi:uncharacterized protein FOMMEDRAFT_156792 [Fomitiporia mediterranea MF3/22]|uniref:uncharacterized protein n=1 Tax=Fomitiporia mediterranea (strain MF3/22) TaxID=694068 RepID=UPI000440834C|nr:uncharacterized protein FOMMEDRAFT_156792 [Fomitiporia mediterranea MF3/22]EJD03388.1 hypothetical protein FOMMEDRAFT_156792 [Fomitiporia mediterranea MF3/22]
MWGIAVVQVERRSRPAGSHISRSDQYTGKLILECSSRRILLKTRSSGLLFFVPFAPPSFRYSVVPFPSQRLGRVTLDMNQTVHGLSMGAVLITSWFAIALSGVMLLQAYIYYRGRPQNDHRIFGAMVLVLLILDMAHVVCIMITLYHYLIRNFGNNNALAYLVPSLALTVGLTVRSNFVFAERLRFTRLKPGYNHILCSKFLYMARLEARNNVIAPIIFVLQVARLISGWVTTVKAIEFGTFIAWTHQVRWIFTAGVAIAVVCDILITGSLCYWLHGSRTGLHGMDEIIDKIILYSVENGALTCFSSIASLICAIIMPGNLVFIGIHFVISKLYINSVLASLNTRNSFRAQKERHGRKIFTGLFQDVQVSRENGSGSVRESSYALQPPKSPSRAHSSHLSASSPSIGKDEAISQTAFDFIITNMRREDGMTMEEAFDTKNKV